MKAGLAVWGWGVRRPKYFTIYYRSTRSLQENMRISLLWRHNGHNGVSNHQPHDYLLNRSLRRTSKKTSKPCVTGLLRGIHRWPVNSPHKWPVMRKMFPLDDVIKCQGNLREISGKKLCRSMGTLSAFHLVQFYVWPLLKSISHIYSNKPTCC